MLAVRAAAAFKVGARAAGVGETTFYTWLARGHAERRRLGSSKRSFTAVGKPGPEARCRAAQLNIAMLDCQEFAGQMCPVESKAAELTSSLLVFDRDR